MKTTVEDVTMVPRLISTPKRWPGLTDPNWVPVSSKTATLMLQYYDYQHETYADCSEIYVVERGVRKVLGYTRGMGDKSETVLFHLFTANSTVTHYGKAL